MHYRIAAAFATFAVALLPQAGERVSGLAARPSSIEIAFAPVPQQAALYLIERAIGGAQDSIFVAAYEFTSKPIADALCRAAARGVAVSVVLDAAANRHGAGASKRDALIGCGAAVRGNGRYAIMHDKFMVIDGRDVETGSFNYTAAASARNAENAVVVWNAPQLASRYATEFERLFAEGEE